jgi:agmatinase
MNYIKYPSNFGMIEKDSYEDSKVVILPVPYEKTTTYVKGTNEGPEAIINASRYMELYDEEIKKDFSEIGICTLNPLHIEGNHESMMDEVGKEVKKILEAGKFPIVLGGEHSITPGVVSGFTSMKNLSIMQLDAHADLRNEYNDSKFNHACALRRTLEFCNKIVSVGIRSLDEEEAIFIEENKIKTYWAEDIHDNDDWMDESISFLSENVFITFDLDVLDPSIMPSIGTPEPGGLGYYQILKFLRKVFEKKNIIGFDVMELCPNKDNIAPDFTAAKIIYKMIGYKFGKK